ncbi:hypothetical protein MYX84_07625 [Acidobacteria bacterium AH-259-O06]|nr:hypothetical protein [Acidobacteria bacterium AH-259-O06]
MKKRVFGVFTAFSLYLQASLHAVRERRAYGRAYERLLQEGGQALWAGAVPGKLDTYFECAHRVRQN